MRRNGRRLLITLACAALVSACQLAGPSSAMPSPTSTPSVAATSTAVAPPTPSATFLGAKYLQMRADAVHVWSSGPGQFPTPDVTVRDAVHATALLQMAAQLHVAPLRFCPIDFGYAYTIEWQQDGRLVAEGSLQAQGCRELTLDGGPGLETTSDFWNALAALIGVPEPSLHPTLP